MAADIKKYVSKAVLSNFRVSPRKARLVVDTIRGRSVEEAVNILSFENKKSASVVKKLVLSAAANASRHSVDVDELYVKAIWVDEAKKAARWLPRAHGRATPIIKRSSTITVVLDEMFAGR